MSNLNKSGILPVSMKVNKRKSEFRTIKYILIILIICITINVYLNPIHLNKSEDHGIIKHRSLDDDLGVVNVVNKPSVITHEYTLKYQIENYSCHYLTWTIATEPFTKLYKRQDLEIDVNGPILSSFSWHGYINTLDLNVNLNDNFVLFKIEDNELYVAKSEPSFNNVLKLDYGMIYMRTWIETLLITMFHYFIPDVVFLMYFGHGPVPCHIPALGTVLNSNCGNKAGFAIPDPQLLLSALGTGQMGYMINCMENRRNQIKIKNKAIWRTKSKSNSMSNNKRIEEEMKLNGNDLIEYIKEDNNTTDITIQNEIIEKFELYSNYSAIIISDDEEHTLNPSNILFRLLNDVPLVLVHSKNEKYINHLTSLLQNQHFIFNCNMLNLETKIKEILKLDINKKNEILNEMHKFALEHLTQFGLYESIAYILNIYANKMNYDTNEIDKEFHLVKKSKCCEINKSVPVQMIKRLRFFDELNKRDISL